MENYSQNMFFVLLGTCAFVAVMYFGAWAVTEIQHRLEMRGR